jgi:pimeloyl-ACP methyl ester carboxylesterase
LVTQFRLDVCDFWDAPTPAAVENEPVATDIPTLIMAGEYDPITPPAYAERVKADGLGNSVHLVGRGQGHGLVGVGCVPRLLRAFLDAPAPAELDAACLELEPPMPFFLSLLGPAP